MTATPAHRWAVWTLAAGLMGCVWACDSSPEPVAPELAGQLAQMPYPKDAPVDDLDIVVVQDDAGIVLTNRTAVEYQNVCLWLNQEYVGLAKRIPIGVESRFELVHFINLHGEPFPTGGWLTPDKAGSVVLAELFDTQASDRVDSTGIGSSSVGRFRLLVRQPQP